jgi:hypothetical protein
MDAGDAMAAAGVAGSANDGASSLGCGFAERIAMFLSSCLSRLKKDTGT